MVQVLLIVQVWLSGYITHINEGENTHDVVLLHYTLYIAVNGGVEVHVQPNGTVIRSSIT